MAVFILIATVLAAAIEALLRNGYTV